MVDINGQNANVEAADDKSLVTSFFHPNTLRCALDTSMTLQHSSATGRLVKSDVFDSFQKNRVKNTANLQARDDM